MSPSAIIDALFNAFVALLNALRPLIGFAALLFAILAAWGVLCEVMPFLKAVMAPKGDPQRMAIIAGALALASGGHIGGK